MYPNGKGWIILDRSTFEKHKDSPWLINLLFNFNISYGDEGRKLGYITALKSEEHGAVKAVSEKTGEGLTKEKGIKEKIEKAALDKQEAERLVSMIINDNKIKDTLNKFAEDDKDFLYAKIRETADAKLISAENIAKVKENLETWLISLLELRSMFSESVFGEGWIAKEFNHYFRIFTTTKGRIQHRLFNGELYFWVNDAEYFYNIFKLGSNGKLQQIARDAEIFFFENKAYLVTFDKDTKLNKIFDIKRDGAVSLILDNVVLLNSSNIDKEKEWVVFTEEENRIKVKIISQAGVRELYTEFSLNNGYISWPR